MMVCVSDLKSTPVFLLVLVSVSTSLETGIFISDLQQKDYDVPL